MIGNSYINRCAHRHYPLFGYLIFNIVYRLLIYFHFLKFSMHLSCVEIIFICFIIFADNLQVVLLEMHQTHPSHLRIQFLSRRGRMKLHCWAWLWAKKSVNSFSKLLVLDFKCAFKLLCLLYMKIMLLDKLVLIIISFLQILN